MIDFRFNPKDLNEFFL